MEDRAASAARPGKATLRPGRGEVRMPGEASEEFTALLDPEVGSTSPAVKVIELQPPSGPPHVVVRAGKPAHRAFLVELPCLAMTPRVRGLVLLNLVMLACASTFVVLKEGQEGVDPFVFSAVRFTIAALTFSPFWRRAARDERLIRGGLEIGVWAAGGYLTQSVGMLTADASRGAFLSGFTVVVVPLLAGAFGTAKLKRMTWVSVAAALVGIMLLEDSGAPPSWGDFWSFASAVLFGVQIYRTEHWSKLCGGKNALPMMSVALVMCAAAAVTGMLIAFPAQAMQALQNPQSLEALLATVTLPWGAILYMGLIVTAMGLWAEVIALQDVSSIEAAIIYTLEPVAGAAFAYVLLGERWGPTGWAGAILILVSCLGTQLYGAEKEPGH